MSVAEPQQSQERRISPVRTSGTNNPFRRGPQSPAIAGSPGRRPQSPNVNNPFVDSSLDLNKPEPQGKSRMPPPKSSKPEHDSMKDTEEFLKNLTFDSRPPKTNENIRPQTRHGPPRHSREESKGKRPDGSNVFADPPNRRPSERPRRNSDTSVVERKALSPEDERRRREDRERRRRDVPRDSQGRPIPSSGRSKRPSKRLDVIDKLDGTSIFGTGLFHHDGPFDALNPHRNRKGSNRAPMQAFLKDSKNNTMGGAGPLNKNIDLARIHGHQEDSFSDFNNHKAVRDARQTYESYDQGGVDRASFNPGAKVERIYGSESYGLGATTFLDGAPAARTAIQRRESEDAQQAATSGLQRKKSLANRLRGMSNGRPRRGEPGVTSPESRYFDRTTSPEMPLSGGGSMSASAAVSSKANERNPFFLDYDAEYDKKGASIRAVEQQQQAGGPPKKAPPPPPPQGRTSDEATGEPLTAAVSNGASASATAAAAKAMGGDDGAPLARSATEGQQPQRSLSPDANGDAKPAGGFMKRMKSLRGGKMKGKDKE